MLDEKRIKALLDEKQIKVLPDEERIKALSLIHISEPTRPY